MTKEIEITLYATVDEDFDLVKFWVDINGNATRQFVRIQNPSYRELKKDVGED